MHQLTLPLDTLDSNEGVSTFALVRHDPFADETPIEAQCDLENPESCESCT